MRKTQEIREAVATDIDALATFNVYSYAKDNIADSDLPAVTVTINSGVYENGVQDCSVGLRIEIKAKATKVENVLDTHAEAIEPLFPIGHTLNDLVEYMLPESFDYAYDSDSSTGTMGLNFNVKYEV